MAYVSKPSIMPYPSGTTLVLCTSDLQTVRLSSGQERHSFRARMPNGNTGSNEFEIQVRAVMRSTIETP